MTLNQLMARAAEGSGETIEPITATVTAADAGGYFPLMWVLIALPALGAVVLLLGGRRTDRWGHLLATLLPLGSFALACLLLVQMMATGVEERLVTLQLWDWVAVGGFDAPFALRLDQLSMVFVMLITGVGSLIHVYSIGYMAHDPDRRKFFAFLNLFLAAMLLLVLADNYLLLYVGWEGVGLASYLLIGFWQQRDSAAVAAKKAFVMNRVGDVGLGIAVMLMFVTFGTVTFDAVFEAAPQASDTVLTLIGLALLLAAVGKSAQFPLQAWLLDAMEGPTPVSALIHAATMVTAGVYLIVRSNAIFDLSPTAVTAVLAVGIVTMLAGAVIACAKDDIKKSLAGSTMSQIGYMFVAAGLGPAGYVFAIFHLLMHGLFKADLFLSAGSVIHGMKDEQDMRFYGALRKAMIVTFIAFLAGFLGISGIPPFDSFFSKDEIIKAAMGTNLMAGIATLLAAGITAFYMTRMLAMTFFGDARWKQDTEPHESPAVMTVPMLLLSVGALFGGVFFLYVADIEAWLEPITGYRPSEPAIPEPALGIVTLAVVAVGIVLAWRQYAIRAVPQQPPQQVSALTVAARNTLYDNAFNEAVFMRPGQYLTRWLVWFDGRAVDGAVRGLASRVGNAGERLRRAQTGFARSYALSMVGGAVAVGVVFVVARWF
jgi:NADH-quinone oxidoreductase subunit L